MKNLNRALKLPKNHSFFLFGPRQTGKSTLLKVSFEAKRSYYYDLLKSEEYLRLSADPALFRKEINARDKSKITHIIVDEIQRIPDLLNEIHHLMEGEKPPFFILSGSSARKLKRVHANLLGGRAWTYHLFPLTHYELGENFDLEKSFERGTLPSIYLSQDNESSQRTLRSYVETYLKEEIQQESLIRNIGGFLRFLPLAGHESGNVLNYSNIARETGVSYNTVKEYFKILEDTLLGFFLLPYSKGFRKRLVKHPKFYFFDTGVYRALMQKTTTPIQRRTVEYGKLFEHFMIAEILRLSAYSETDYRFSFYCNSNDVEVDLVIETPHDKVYAIEFKSTDKPDSSALRGLRSFKEICPKASLYCASLVPRKQVISDVTVVPWSDLFELIGL